MSDFESLPVLNEDQRRALELVLTFSRENRRWPTYRWLNQLLYVEYERDLIVGYGETPLPLDLRSPAALAADVAANEAFTAQSGG